MMRGAGLYFTVQKITKQVFVCTFIFSPVSCCLFVTFPFFRISCETIQPKVLTALSYIASKTTKRLSVKLASATLQDNEAIVGAAVEVKGDALEYASDRLRGDESIVLELSAD